MDSERIEENVDERALFAGLRRPGDDSEGGKEAGRWARKRRGGGIRFDNPKCSGERRALSSR